MGEPLDFDQARRFVALVPLARHGDEVPGVYRVLNVSGEVSPGWHPASADLPPNRARVKARLETEGVRFDERGRADPSQRCTYWSGESEPKRIELERLAANPDVQDLRQLQYSEIRVWYR